MSFRTLYDNPLLTTALPCVVAAAVVALAQRKRGLVRTYGTVFGVAIAADAWLDNAWSPLKSGSTLATAIAVFFVIFGDFRYFVVLEASLRTKHKLGRAAAWAFAVPVASEILRRVFPRIGHDDRATFLLYELLFFALAAFIDLVLVRRAKDARLARAATRFELLQYGIWIAADVGLSLTRIDLFHGVRIVANLLYYVAFVPVMMRLLDRREAP